MADAMDAASSGRVVRAGGWNGRAQRGHLRELLSPSRILRVSVAAHSGLRAVRYADTGTGRTMSRTSARVLCNSSTSNGFLATAAIQRPICANSSVPSPRVVAAGVPDRMPLVTLRRSWVEGNDVLVGVEGGLVQGFLHDDAGDVVSLPRASRVDEHQMVVCAAADQAQTLIPVARRRAPARCPESAADNSRKSGLSASPKPTALAAMTCMSGPPCVPGKTARSMARRSSSRHRIMPPRGPRNVLCVVDVTTSQ